MALRGGYHYDPTPVPPQPGVTNFVDASRHVVAMGAGLTLVRLGRAAPGALSLDLHAALQVLESRTVVKADPNDPVGDYRLHGTVLNLGANLSLSFE